MARMNFPFVCGLDWLQIYCFLHRDLVDLDDVSIKVKVRQFPTAQFLAAADVLLPSGGVWLPFCRILFKPRTSVLPAVAAQIKIENRALYESELMPRFAFVCSRLDIEYRSLSRVDVFYDCNRYYGGRRPRQFLADYIGQRVLKIGINRGVINFGNFGYMVANGARKMPQGFRVGAPQWNAITWGGRDYVQAQIYNKTKELNEVKYKPHIVAAWERAGLDPSDVWRSEIRIVKQGKSLQLLDSGDLFALGVSEVADDARVKELFQTYADRYFRFVKRDYHAKRQQMRPVRLFCDLIGSEPVIKPKINPARAHSNRTTKLVTNFLIRLQEYIHERAVMPTNEHMENIISEVLQQLKVTFPSYLFDERPTCHIDVFRRLNDRLLRRQHLAGLPIDMFVQRFLRDE